MTVKQLKELLSDCDDEAIVAVAINLTDDRIVGRFISSVIRSAEPGDAPLVLLATVSEDAMDFGPAPGESN